MRHLNKSYPYQKPSKNRSSKDLNMLIGNASVFPAYLKWGDEQLARFSSRCKNKNNCYQYVLNSRLKARSVKNSDRNANVTQESK